MADQLDQIREHARPFLEDGEEMIAVTTASPRGRMTAMAAGGVGTMIGQKMVGGQVKRAQHVGLRVESDMAVVLTPRRLLTLKVSYTMRGTIKGVREVLSSIPLSDVDSIEAKRVGLGAVLVLAVSGGEPVKLECQVGRARRIADAFNQTAGRAVA
jgi:hypothetical protein